MSAGKSWVYERCGMVSEKGLLHMGNAKERIESGKAVLGIEFGSTRIKAVLVDETHQPIASGARLGESAGRRNLDIQPGYDLGRS